MFTVDVKQQYNNNLIHTMQKLLFSHTYLSLFSNNLIRCFMWNIGSVARLVDIQGGPIVIRQYQGLDQSVICTFVRIKKSVNESHFILNNNEFILFAGKTLDVSRRSHVTLTFST